MELRWVGGVGVGVEGAGERLAGWLAGRQPGWLPGWSGGRRFAGSCTSGRPGWARRQGRSARGAPPACAAAAGPRAPGARAQHNTPAPTASPPPLAPTAHCRIWPTYLQLLAATFASSARDPVLHKYVALVRDVQLSQSLDGLMHCVLQVGGLAGVLGLVWA